MVDRCCRRPSGQQAAPVRLADRRLLLCQQRAVRAAVVSVDLLFRTGGTSATRPGERLQRYFRDMSTIRTHITMGYDRTAENYARLHLGCPPPRRSELASRQGPGADWDRG